MKRRSGILIAAVLLVAVAACTFTKTNLKPEQEFLMRAEAFYLAQYNDYKSMATQPNLTEDQKNVLRAKKKALVEVEPLLKLYGAMVYAGNVPDPSLEVQIINLLNQIGGKF